MIKFSPYFNLKFKPSNKINPFGVTISTSLKFISSQSYSIIFPLFYVDIIYISAFFADPDYTFKYLPYSKSFNTVNVSSNNTVYPKIVYASL